MMNVLSAVDDDMAEKKGRGKSAAPGETWLAVRVPQAVKERIEEMAGREYRSVSNVLRRLVLDGLEVDLTPALLEMLRAVAARRGVSVATLMREVIENVEREEREERP